MNHAAALALQNHPTSYTQSADDAAPRSVLMTVHYQPQFSAESTMSDATLRALQYHQTSCTPFADYAAASSPLVSSAVYRELQGCIAKSEAERRNLDVLVEDVVAAAMTPLYESVIGLVDVVDWLVYLHQLESSDGGCWG